MQRRADCYTESTPVTRTFQLASVMALSAISTLSVACTSSWQGEAEAPQSAYDEYPPGTSVAYPPPAEAPPSQTVAVSDGATATGPAVDYADVDDTDPSAVATFEPVLSPYGAWVDDPTYGYVWVPDASVVGSNFQPYVTAGHWSYTDEGYYWASDYEWGWAPFHYGRWVWIDGRGWSWVAGARYSPAWVDWRYGGGYIGWGPMYPHYCWHGGSVMWINAGPTPWVFAPSNRFFDPQPVHAIAPPAQAPGIVASTHPYAPPVNGGYQGQKPFVGPDPKVAGIPQGSLNSAKVPVPAKSQPQNVAWKPAPNSKVAPYANATPKLGAAGAAAPTYAKPSAGYASPSLKGPDAPVAKAPQYNGPTYHPVPSSPSLHPPTYGSPTYHPPTSSPSYSYGSPSYGPKPMPTPSGPIYSKPSGGAPVYHPAPTYSPPTYAHPSAPSYSAPSYAHPSAPSYSHPSAPTYSAPSYHPSPSFGGGSHPSFGGGGYAHPSGGSKPSTHFGGGGGKHK